MVKYRLSNCLNWASEPFGAKHILEFYDHAIDILIDYNMEMDDDKWHARIYKELQIKYMQKQLSGAPKELYHDLFMGMMAKHSIKIKSLLEAQFSVEYDRWFRPALSDGRTFIKNIDDIESVWNMLQRGIKHYMQLCAFCNSIAE